MHCLNTINNYKKNRGVCFLFILCDKIIIGDTMDIELIKNANNNDAGGGDTAAPIFKDIVEKLCDK